MNSLSFFLYYKTYSCRVLVALRRTNLQGAKRLKKEYYADKNVDLQCE
jgi:hypothetical protein